MKPQHDKLKVIDPLRPQPEIDLSDQKGSSPWDPPDGFSKAVEGVAVEDMHPYLRVYMTEHIEYAEHLEAFDADVGSIRKAGSIDQAGLAKLKRFFEFHSSEVVPHSRREEQELFSILRQRMLDNGEHGVGANPITPIAVLEAEHVEAIETAAIAFSFLALACRLKDAESKEMVLSIGLERCQALSEMLKLHIHREDKIVFPLAQKFMSPEDFASLEPEAKSE